MTMIIALVRQTYNVWRIVTNLRLLRALQYFSRLDDSVEIETAILIDRRERV